MNYTYFDLAKMIDHSLLNPTLTEADLDAAAAGERELRLMMLPGTRVFRLLDDDHLVLVHRAGEGEGGEGGEVLIWPSQGASGASGAIGVCRAGRASRASRASGDTRVSSCI